MLARILEFALQAADSGLIPGRLQKLLWRRWYQTLNLRWEDDAWTFMNYGYVSDDSETDRPLAAEDEDHRLFIALYDQALPSIPLTDLRVLEVGAGRGGGASFIARYLAPASVTGLDFSLNGIAFCKRAHANISGLDFVHGDAEALPFEDSSFDVVVNIESSHCYGNMTRFVEEVVRVLRPGGHFAWADLRGKKMVADTESAFVHPNLELMNSRDITANVVAALDQISEKKMELIEKMALNKKFMRQFSGTRGSITYLALSGEYAVYISRTFRKSGVNLKIS